MDASPCVLLLVPAGALGGIDLLSFTTTDRFKGIKELPPGWHFVFTSSTNSLSVRHGAWFRVRGSSRSSPSSPPELFVKKWDPEREELVPETDQAELMRWRANLGAIWRDGLTPYRQTASKDADDEGDKEEDWRRLTDAVDERLLDRVLGAATEDHWSLTSASSAARDMDVIPGLSKEQSQWQPEKELALLPVDLKRTWGVDVVGRERTEAAKDRSWALGDLVERVCGGREEELLGAVEEVVGAAVDV
ncbi:Putative cyclase [Macrophomina phaseolina MS6]|uniref:Putative cyclase n=1 Tax=Macrophomina phaseolina (strain MS6) TaxID=1126212 RepID=K2STV4_MACPH|nr:Putative cyclase [Macrophomina phaseolina MS6]